MFKTGSPLKKIESSPEFQCLCTVIRFFLHGLWREIVLFIKVSMCTESDHLQAQIKPFFNIIYNTVCIGKICIAQSQWNKLKDKSILRICLSFASF